MATIMIMNDNDDDGEDGNNDTDVRDDPGSDVI
jgi:hypothetical protein